MRAFKKFQSFIKPYKQQIRGFLGWLFGLVSQMVLDVDAVMGWSTKRWLLGLGVAALPGIVGFMKGGEDNLTPEEMYEKIHAVKKARAAAGVEVTGERPLVVTKLP
jgi:hypothetical protein